MAFVSFVNIQHSFVHVYSDVSLIQFNKSYSLVDMFRITAFRVFFGSIFFLFSTSAELTGKREVTLQSEHNSVCHLVAVKDKSLWV